MNQAIDPLHAIDPYGCLVESGEDFFGIFDSEEAVTAALMGEERVCLLFVFVLFF